MLDDLTLSEARRAVSKAAGNGARRYASGRHAAGLPQRVRFARLSMTTPRYPSLFEINTRAWLCRLSQEAGKPVTLATVDDATLDDLARRGFDWIWLLSVWQTGAASRAVSRGNPGLAGRVPDGAAGPDARRYLRIGLRHRRLRGR